VMRSGTMRVPEAALPKVPLESCKVDYQPGGSPATTTETRGR
jgi:hypothetical protein